ncbi:MAG TPA: ABC transporter permease [Vicinamibacteria bacterium]|nr:ABC transporter permease [Vicinamibacteria bacterium]
MKFLPYLLKHLRRNWFRTTLTVLAMALCIFLFCTLQSVLAQIQSVLDSRSAKRLVTRNSVSIVFDLPMAYEGRIQSVSGVERVAMSNWFGGSLPAKKEGKAEEGSSSTTDWSNFFPNLAVELEPFLAMYPEYQIPPDQYRGLLADQRGCAIGRKLSDKFGWKPGDTFYLESFIPVHRKPDGPFEFVVRAVFDTDPVRFPGTDTNLMLFDRKYLYEATGRKLQAGVYYVEIKDPERAGEVSTAIDRLFENSDHQTHTETEKAFAASFVAMAGNLSLLLNGIGIAVTFTILLVVANTMSIAVRERRTEIAVLKTLGFTSRQVMGLVVAESVLIGVIGGALGVLGSQGIMWVLTHAPGVRSLLAAAGLSELNLRPLVVGLGLANAVFLGFAAGVVPALGAYRARITDMLRTV